MLCSDPNKKSTVLYIGTSHNQKEILVGHKFGITVFNAQDGSLRTEIKKYGGVGPCASAGGWERLAIVGTCEEREESAGSVAGEARDVPDQNFSLENAGPRTVTLLDGGEVRGRIALPTQVLNIRMTQHHLIVILEYSFEVYELDADLTTWRKRLCEETQQNIRGACAVSADEKHLLVPGAALGSVVTYSLETCMLEGKSDSSHAHPVAALAMSGDGALVASGSTCSGEARLGALEGSTLRMALRFKRGSTWSCFTAMGFSEDGKVFGMGSNSANRTFHFYSTEVAAKGITNWIESWTKREAREKIGSFTTTLQSKTTGIVVFLPVDAEENIPFVILTEDLNFYTGMIKKDNTFVAPTLKETLQI